MGAVNNMLLDMLRQVKRRRYGLIVRVRGRGDKMGPRGRGRAMGRREGEGGGCSWKQGVGKLPRGGTIQLLSLGSFLKTENLSV